MKSFIQFYKDSYAGLPKAAWLLALVVLVNRIGMMVIFFMTLYLTRQLNFSVIQAGQIMSIWGAGSLVGSYLGGVLSDKWGTYRVQLLSLIWGGIGYILLLQVTRFWQIAAVIFVVAVVADAFRPASITAFMEVCPPEIRTRGIVLNRLAANLGVAVGPAIGGVLAMKSYDYLFWADGLTCLSAAVLFAWLFRKYRKSSHLIDEDGGSSVSPWKDGLFIFAMGLLLLIGIVFFQLFGTWPIYMREVNQFLENQIGLLMTINCLLIAIIEMPLIHKFENSEPFRLISAGVILLFSGFFLLPFGHSYAYVVMTVVLWTFGEMLIFPLIATFIANRATDATRGRYMGVFTFTFSGAFVLGPMMGSWIYDGFGPRTLWLSTGIIAVLVFRGFQVVGQKLHKKAAA